MNYKEQIGELEGYITSLVNASSDNLDSYSRAFCVRVEEEKIKIIFNSPTGFLLDEKLYFTIRKTIQVPLYPILTLKHTNNMIVEENKSDNIADMRAFSYPFSWGVPKRLIYKNLNDITYKNNNEINIMTDVSIKITEVTSVMLSGGSGSGKSYLINILLKYFFNFTDKEKIYIVDGKRDLPAIFARENNIKNITTNSLDTPDQTLNKVCELLSEINKKIDERQEKLFNGNIKEELKPIFVVIDEVGALVSMASKQLKDRFNSLLTRISILGRQSKVIILLASQRLDANTIPTIIREQANILIQLGHLNKNSLQYLFPELNQDSIFIPYDEEKRGIGIIQINNDLHTLLVPSIRGD